MSSIPSSGKPGNPRPGGATPRPAAAKPPVTQPAAAAKPAPAAKPAAAAGVTDYAPAPAKAGGGSGGRRNVLIAAGAGGAVVLAVLIGLVVWWQREPEPPRMNSEPQVIAKYLATPAFEKLPFHRQRDFMELMDDKDVKDAAEQAHAAGQLTDEEWGKALQAAYFGEWLGKMDKYYEKKGPSDRRAYIDKLLDKKEEKKDEKKAPKAPKGNDPKKGEPKKASGKVKRDDSRQAEQIAAWPAEIQSKWTEFRNAYEQRKEQRKKQEEETATAGTQSEANK